jgi:hypothetical protein
MVNLGDFTDEELAFLVYAAERLEVHKFSKDQGFSDLFYQEAEALQNELYAEYRRRSLHYKKFLKKG